MSSSPTLIVVHRIEPGCLGPEGDTLVDAFCARANADFRSLQSGACMHFLVLPRRDKSQSETQYRLIDKNLPRDKASIFLARLSIDIDALEEEMADRIAALIEDFCER